MSFAVHLALWLIRRACAEEHREEIEGDLLELHARRLSFRSPFRAGLEVFSEALFAAHSRRSEALVRKVLLLALVLTGVAVGIAYMLLTKSLAEPSVLSGPFVFVGTTLELLFWYLLFMAGGSRASRGG